MIFSHHKQTPKQIYKIKKYEKTLGRLQKIAIIKIFNRSPFTKLNPTLLAILGQLHGFCGGQLILPKRDYYKLI